MSGRLFPCPYNNGTDGAICDKGPFYRKEHLQRHLATHERDRKRFRCAACSLAYVRHDGLQRHFEVCHSKGPDGQKADPELAPTSAGRTKNACRACAKSKVKCEIADGRDECRRCLDRNKPCDRPSRVRKRMDQQDGDSSPSVGRDSSGSDLAPSIPDPISAASEPGELGMLLDFPAKLDTTWDSAPGMDMGRSFSVGTISPSNTPSTVATPGLISAAPSRRAPDLVCNTGVEAGQVPGLSWSLSPTPSTDLSGLGASYSSNLDSGLGAQALAMNMPNEPDVYNMNAEASQGVSLLDPTLGRAPCFDHSGNAAIHSFLAGTSDPMIFGEGTINDYAPVCESAASSGYLVFGNMGAPGIAKVPTNPADSGNGAIFGHHAIPNSHVADAGDLFASSANSHMLSQAPLVPMPVYAPEVVGNHTWSSGNNQVDIANPYMPQLSGVNGTEVAEPSSAPHLSGLHFSHPTYSNSLPLSAEQCAQMRPAFPPPLPMS